MNEQQQQLQLFLQKIQLNQFYAEIVNVLHITRVEHFDHVVESDLQSIGMSMPEIRRLFDHLKKNKKNPFLEKLKVCYFHLLPYVIYFVILSSSYVAK